MKLPSDFEILTEIYERYYDEFKNFSREKPTRECKVYVPIDIKAVAADLETDESLLFGRFYNYMNTKYKGNEESPLFSPNVGKDKHAIHFPLLASVLADLREESKKQRLQEPEHDLNNNDKQKTTSSNVITATNSTVILGDSNVVANKTKTEIASKKAWHETAAFKIIVPILIGLLVTFLAYYFHWK